MLDAASAKVRSSAVVGATLRATLLASLLSCGPEGLGDEFDPVLQAATTSPRTVFLNFTGARCGYGTLDECKRKLQGLLDTWYADFNVVFVHLRPATGDYYTVNVTFNGSAGSGRSQLSCNDQFGKTIICDAQVGGAGALVSNAGTIAHEHGHAVGLHHSDGATDIMNQRADNKSAGFEDKDNNLLDNKHCGALQNSYRLMLARLGAWPGGCKSGPYGEFCPKGSGAAAPPPDAGAATGGSAGHMGNGGRMGQAGTGGDATGGRGGRPVQGGAGGSMVSTGFGGKSNTSFGGFGGTATAGQGGSDSEPDMQGSDSEGGCAFGKRSRTRLGGPFVMLLGWMLARGFRRNSLTAPGPKDPEVR